MTSRYPPNVTCSGYLCRVARRPQYDCHTNVLWLRVIMWERAPLKGKSDNECVRVREYCIVLGIKFFKALNGCLGVWQTSGTKIERKYWNNLLDCIFCSLELSRRKTLRRKRKRIYFNEACYNNFFMDFTLLFLNQFLYIF